MITHSDLVLNRILHTKDGSRMGNAIITKVNSTGASAASVLFGSVVTYDLMSDYGNEVKNANLNQINNQFSLGHIATPDHKHYTKPKVVPLDWKKLVDFVAQATNRAPGLLNSEEASELIADARYRYSKSYGFKHEIGTSPVWRQGQRVPVAGGPVERREPFIKGDEKDYLA